MNLRRLEKNYLPVVDKLGPRCLQGRPLHRSLLIHREGALAVFYAPLGLKLKRADYNRIKILLVGLTPGMNQVELAFEDYFRLGISAEYEADEEEDRVSYAKSMRTNLVNMLDDIGVARAMAVPSTTALFSTHKRYSLRTSILRYPVFYRGENYSGHQPPIFKRDFLMQMSEDLFGPLLDQVRSDTLIVPLGKAVTRELERLLESRPSLDKQCLFGFPHASGRCGERAQVFRRNKASLRKIVKRVLG